MKIRVAPIALNDLMEIKRYIEKDLSNPIAAKNVIKKIIEDYGRLEASPLIGAPLSAKIGIETDFRYLVSGNYLVFYKLNDAYVSVYRILYGRRDYLKIIFNDLRFEE